MSGNRQNWFEGWRLFAVLALTLIALSLWIAGMRQFEVDGVRMVIRFTARTSLLLFCLAFGAAALATLINAIFGLLVAWVLVRFDFPGRRLLSAAIDLPFALPTAVAGIALTAIYANTGWVGAWLDPLGIEIAYRPQGIVVALIFIGLPFIVRAVEPVLGDLDRGFEEAAASLGATRWQVFSRVIFPEIAPSLVTGCALAFARCVGEYGSVIFIAGNIPKVSEIAPLLIVTSLEQYDYAGASAIAVVMLVLSFALLAMINRLQHRAERKVGL